MSTYKLEIKLGFFDKVRFIGKQLQANVPPAVKKKWLKIKFPKVYRAISGVTPGNIAVVLQEGASINNFGGEEVYIGGDQIIKESIMEQMRWQVVELFQIPGRLDFSAEIPLACLPQIKLEDKLSIRFMLDIHIHKPIILLSRATGWQNDYEAADKALSKNVEDAIRNEWDTIMNDGGLHIATHPDLDIIKAEIIDRLKDKLSYFGLSINPHSMSGRRIIPDILYDLIFEFIKAENDIIPSVGSFNSNLVRKLNLDEIDIVEIEGNLSNYGRGAGLFLYIVKDYDVTRLDTLIDFFKTTSTPSIAAANFIRDYKDKKYTEREMEFTKLVFLAGFRNPLVGLGEKYDWTALRELNMSNRQLQEVISNFVK